MTTESFAVVGALAAVLALIASQRLTTLVARDVGLTPVQFPRWSFFGALIVGAASLARNENEPFALTAIIASVSALMLMQTPLDLATRRLSRSATLTVSAMILLVVGIDANDNFSSALIALGATALVTAVYVVLHRVSPSSLGWGDVLLVVPLTLAVGYVALDRVAIWQLVASATGAMHAFVERRLRGARSIPFGPHLLVSAWLLLLVSV